MTSAHNSLISPDPDERGVLRRGGWLDGAAALDGPVDYRMIIGDDPQGIGFALVGPGERA